jgi:hypothetical protein
MEKGLIISRHIETMETLSTWMATAPHAQLRLGMFALEEDPIQSMSEP